MSWHIYHWLYELKRRKVMRAAIAYAAVGWLLLQVTEIVAEAFALPDWTTRLVLVLLLLALPVVLALAWTFDVGPTGMVRTNDQDGREEWLGVVLWLRVKPVTDQVGNRLSRPRIDLERRLLVLPCLWRRWSGDEGQMVFNSTIKAMWAAQGLREFARSRDIPLGMGLAVGNISHGQEELRGEAAQVARTLAYSAGAFQMLGTEQVHDELIEAPELGGEFLGPIEVEALAHPVRAYRLEWQTTSSGSMRADDRSSGWGVGARASVALAVIGALVGVGWYLQPWQRELPALPSMPLPEASAVYLRIEPPQDPQRLLDEAQLHGLGSALARALQELPGIYPADDAAQPASESLQTRIERSGTSWRLHLTLGAEDGKPARVMSVGGETLQQVFDAAQDAVINALSLRLGLRARSLAHPVPMSEELYEDLLEARYTLTQVPRREQLEHHIERLRGHLEQGHNQLLLDATYCELMLAKSDMLMDPGAVQEAEPNCERLGEANAELGVRLVHARYLLQRGRESDAIRQLDAVLRLQPRNSGAYDLLARIQRQQGNLVEAEHTLVRAISLQPGYWRPLRSLALFQFNESRYEDAARTYRRMVDLAPNNGRVWSDLGAAHFMAGNLGPAADAFKRAVQLEPSQAGFSNLGTLYYYLGRYGDALRNYELALKQAPADYRLYGNVADVLRIQGDREQAQRYYGLALQRIDEYLQSSAETMDTSSLRIMYAFHRGERPNAYAEMRALISQQPGNAELQLYAAQLAKAQADRASVLEHLERAVALGFAPGIISVDPEFAYLGSDAEFTRLVAGSNS